MLAVLKEATWKRDNIYFPTSNNSRPRIAARNRSRMVVRLADISDSKNRRCRRNPEDNPKNAINKSATTTTKFQIQLREATNRCASTRRLSIHTLTAIIRGSAKKPWLACGVRKATRYRDCASARIYHKHVKFDPIIQNKPLLFHSSPVFVQHNPFTHVCPDTQRSSLLHCTRERWPL